MQSSIVIFVFVIIGATLYEDVQGAKTCKEQISDMTKMQMTMMSKCAKSMKFKNGKEKAAKSMCIMKCVLKDVGMLDEAGRTGETQFKTLVAKFFEKPEHQDYVFNVLNPCQVEHGPNMDPDEEFCKSYDPFIKCLMGKLMQVCPPGA